MDDLKQRQVMHGWVLASYHIATLSVLGLAFLPTAWRSLTKARPMPPASHGRLFPLWQPHRLVGMFALASLVSLVLNQIFGHAIFPWITTWFYLITDEHTAWWASAWSWLAWAVVMVALPMVFLCQAFAPNFSRLGRVLGFTRNDFACLPYVALALASMGPLPWVFECLDAGLDYLGATSGILDGLSRSFSEFESFSLPIGIFLGVLLAPFLEEIVFRGFLLRSIQARWGTTAGMLLSSALFAGAHFYSLNGTLHVFGYGLVFSWIYQRTGKLAPCMIVHAAGNLDLTLFAHFTGG